jgi:hypothetical protein
MWSGGNRRRPPTPPRGAGRYTSQTRIGARPAGVRVARGRSAGGQSVWRRLRQRIRALWRWGVVRTVRHWFGSATVRSEFGGDAGEVKQFPQSRWH